MIIYKDKILPGIEEPDKPGEAFTGYQSGNTTWEYDRELDQLDLYKLRDLLSNRGLEYLVLRKDQYDDDGEFIFEGVSIRSSNNEVAYGRDIYEVYNYFLYGYRNTELSKKLERVLESFDYDDFKKFIDKD